MIFPSYFPGAISVTAPSTVMETLPPFVVSVKGNYHSVVYLLQNVELHVFNVKYGCCALIRSALNIYRALLASEYQPARADVPVKLDNPYPQKYNLQGSIFLINEQWNEVFCFDLEQ